MRRSAIVLAVAVALGLDARPALDEPAPRDHHAALRAPEDPNGFLAARAPVLAALQDEVELVPLH